jgi:hypothetical protein
MDGRNGSCASSALPDSRLKQLQAWVRGLAADDARGDAIDMPSKSERAQGMPGEGLTHGPPADKKQAAVTTGSADHRHSLRDGFNAYT